MAVADELRCSEADEEGEEASSSDENPEEAVGVLESPASEEGRRLLTRRMFPSKVGGRPAWLIPRNLPGAEGDGLLCKKCGRPLRFLLQIYASRGNVKQDCFHRVLHVFVCTNCQPNELRAFRAQLPRRNLFYSSEAPKASKVARALAAAKDRDPALDALTCASCGLPYTGDHEACSECERLMRYGDPAAFFMECELSTRRAEAAEDDDAELQQSDLLPPAASSKASVRAQAEDDVEEIFTEGAAKAAGRDRDPLADADAAIDAARTAGAGEAVIEKLRLYKEKVTESVSSCLDVSEEKAFAQLSKERGDYDPQFATFTRFATANGPHVLRYAFSGAPLWFSEHGQLAQDPPRCDLCRAARVFEFQVQPQLIALLAGATPAADRLDFGVVCCYVCEDSCTPPEDAPYAEEFVYVQPEPHEAWLPKA